MKHPASSFVGFNLLVLCYGGEHLGLCCVSTSAQTNPHTRACTHLTVTISGWESLGIDWITIQSATIQNQINCS